MGINISNQPGLVGLGQAAYGIGDGQFQQKTFQNAFELMRSSQQERLANNNLAYQVWGQQFNARANQDSQLRQISARQAEQANTIGAQRQSQAESIAATERMAQFRRFENAEARSSEEAMRNHLANQEFLQQKQLNEQRNELDQSNFRMKLDEQDKRRLQELNNQVRWVRDNEGWSDDQKAQAIEQLQMQYNNIQPLPQPKEEEEPPPWPAEQSPGLIFEDRGYLWSREIDANGNVRLKQHSSAMSDGSNQRDQQPFRMGNGVYRYDAAGKMETVVPPPSPPDAKMYADIFSKTYEQFSKTAGVNPATGETTPVDTARVREAAAEQIRFIMDNMATTHEMMVNQALGVQSQDNPYQNNPYQQDQQQQRAYPQSDFYGVGGKGQVGEILSERQINESSFPVAGSQDELDQIDNGEMYIDAWTGSLQRKINDRYKRSFADDQTQRYMRDNLASELKDKIKADAQRQIQSQ